jgi:predicted nucleic acid-binding protein
MKPRVYLETSVISYLASRPSRDLIMAAHQQITQEWWEQRRGKFELLVSQLVLQEVHGGDKSAAERRTEFVKDLAQVQTTDEVIALAQKLLQASALPMSEFADAVHVALAAVHGVDYLVTWNLKHIANAVTRHRIESACRESGFEPPIICTPEELMEA